MYALYRSPQLWFLVKPTSPHLIIKGYGAHRPRGPCTSLLYLYTKNMQNYMPIQCISSGARLPTASGANFYGSWQYSILSCPNLQKSELSGWCGLTQIRLCSIRTSVSKGFCQHLDQITSNCDLYQRLERHQQWWIPRLSLIIETAAIIEAVASAQFYPFISLV